MVRTKVYYALETYLHSIVLISIATMYFLPSFNISRLIGRTEPLETHHHTSPQMTTVSMKHNCNKMSILNCRRRVYLDDAHVCCYLPVLNVSSLDTFLNCLCHFLLRRGLSTTMRPTPPYILPPISLPSLRPSTSATTSLHPTHPTRFFHSNSHIHSF
jgi:hypothetical protein